MNISNADRAKTLIQALPYIQRWSGKIVVVKYGGNTMLDEKLKYAAMQDIVLLTLAGVNVVLVHGGGPEINTNLKKLGVEPKFVDGLRVTDEATMEVVQMTLAGKLNKDIAVDLNRLGGRAIGICGADGGLIRARAKDGGKYGLTGEITGIDPDPVLDLLADGYIPVISTVALGEGEEKILNINADTAAASIAAALGAEKLILLTDVRGLLRDVKDENTLIESVKLSEIEELKKQGVIGGGMIPKVECCEKAMLAGVPYAHIIDGRCPHSLIIELLTDEGVGTMFYREENDG